MKKSMIWLFLAGMVLTIAPAFADEIRESYDGATSVVGTSPNSSETNTVDLSDKSDDTVYSPSLGNTTPAGQAPGQPIE